MMDPMKMQMMEEFMVFTGLMSTLLCATGLGAVWIRARGKRLTQADPRALERLDEIAARLAQLENVAESTAIEVERISEGQRFTTKLLADRGVSQPPAAERGRIAGSTTPH